MSGKEKREEIRRKVESQEFLRETFDYDERGFLVWKADRGSKIRAGAKVGFANERAAGNQLNLLGCHFAVRRLVWLWHGNSVMGHDSVGTRNKDSFDDRIENLVSKPRGNRFARDKSAGSDVEYLRSLFQYDPETGHLSWKIARSHCIKAGSLIQNEAVYVDYSKFYVSRICFVLHHGRPIGDGMLIDHINGNRRDNRAVNLREATYSQNAMNSRRTKAKASGLPKGVYKRSNCSKFEAQIDVNRKRFHLGLFNTPEEASEAYQAAAKFHHGEFACFDR